MGDSCNCTPCCYEDKPYVQCTMLCPPPCLVPTKPEPVKPLQLPCVMPPRPMTDDEAFEARHANFYNNYNVDYHPGNCCPPCSPCDSGKPKGGKPRCEDVMKKKPKCCDNGCPTGFKPCTMKLCPPPCCDPAGVWCATVMPCPPKPPKKVSNLYKPGPCRRPCCKHWKPKDPPCKYDDVCKAACFDHPPGIKPSGINRYLKC